MSAAGQSVVGGLQAVDSGEAPRAIEAGAGVEAQAEQCAAEPHSMAMQTPDRERRPQGDSSSGAKADSAAVQCGRRLRELWPLATNDQLAAHEAKLRKGALVSTTPIDVRGALLMRLKRLYEKADVAWMQECEGALRQDIANDPNPLVIRNRTGTTEPHPTCAECAGHKPGQQPARQFPEPWKMSRYARDPTYVKVVGARCAPCLWAMGLRDVDRSQWPGWEEYHAFVGSAKRVRLSGKTPDRTTEVSLFLSSGLRKAKKNRAD